MPSAQLLMEALCHLSEVTVSLSGAPSVKGGSSNAPSAQGYPFLSRRGSWQSACVKPWTRKMEWRGVVACLHTVAGTQRRIATARGGAAVCPQGRGTRAFRGIHSPGLRAPSWSQQACGESHFVDAEFSTWTSALASCSRRCHAGGPGPDVLGQRQQNLPQSALCRFIALPPEKLCAESDDGMWNVRCGHFCRCGHSCFKMSRTVLVSGLYFLLLVAFAYIAEKY